MSSLYLTGISPPTLPLEQKETKETKLKTVQNDYLEFLIKQEANFANIESINDFYISQLHQQQAKFNRNKSIIKEKEEEHLSLLKLIENELIGKYKITYERFMQYYNDKLSALTYMIQIKEDDIRRYNCIYNRLYHCNFMINKRVNSEKEVEDINEAQIPQFKRQSYHAYLSMTQKQETLTQMNEYKRKVQVKNRLLFAEKEKELNILLLQVEELKKDIVDQEYGLSCLIDSVKAISNEVNHIQELFDNDTLEYRTNQREYHKLDVHLLSLLYKTKTKHIDDFIRENIDRKINYNNMTSSFNYENYEIAKMAKEIQELNDQYAALNRQIGHKMKREIKEGYDNRKISNNEGKRRYIDYTTREISLLVEKKNWILQYIIDYCLRYSKLMIKGEFVPIVVNESSLVYDLLCDHRPPFLLSSDGLNTDAIGCLMSLFHQFSFGFFKVLYCFIQAKITSSQSNYSSTTIVQINSKANTNSYEDTIIDEHHPFEVLNIFSVILPYKSNLKNVAKRRKTITNLSNEMQHQSSNRSLNNDNQSKGGGRGGVEEGDCEQDTLSTSQINTKQKFLSEGKITTQTDMLRKFKNYLKDMNKRQIEKYKMRMRSNQEIPLTISQNNIKRELITNNPRRLKVLFSKFQNEFVISDKTFLTLQKQKGDQHPMRKTIIFPRRNSNMQLQEAMSRLRKLSTSSSEEDQMHDSFEESNNPKSTKESYKNIKKNSCKLQYKFIHKNPEISKIYHRVNDLRSLEHNNFRKRDFELCKDTFDQAYYSLMNKDNPKYLKINSQYSLKNIHSQRKNKDQLHYPDLFIKNNIGLRNSNNNANDVNSMNETSSNGDRRYLLKSLSSPLIS